MKRTYEFSSLSLPAGTPSRGWRAPSPAQIADTAPHGDSRRSHPSDGSPSRRDCWWLRLVRRRRRPSAGAEVGSVTETQWSTDPTKGGAS